MRDRLFPSVSDTYPRWLLPLMLSIIVAIAILGMTGLIKLSGADECEAAGGKYMAGPGGMRGCIEKKEIEPQP